MDEWDKLQSQLSYYKQLNFESDKTIKDLVEELDATTLQMVINTLILLGHDLVCLVSVRLSDSCLVCSSVDQL